MNEQCGKDCPYSKFDLYDPLRSLGNYQCLPLGILYDHYYEPLGYLICPKTNHLECEVYRMQKEKEVENGK